MKQTITFADPMDKYQFPIGGVFEIESAEGREMVRFIEHRMGCSIVQPASYRFKHDKVQRKHDRQDREWKRDMIVNQFMRNSFAKRCRVLSVNVDTGILEYEGPT